MRSSKVVKKLLGLGNDVVVEDWELTEPKEDRPDLVVWIRAKERRKGACGRCGATASWFDQGGGERRWRHIDIGYATCNLIALAPRVNCIEHGPTVAAVPWARHDAAFTRDFDDLVVRDSIIGSKQAAADRYGIS